jgi:histidine ammonia-lyase
MSAVLLGVGEVFIRGDARGALDGLCVAGLAPLTLQAKEGLALLNGTQASTALALDNMFAIEDLYRTALVAGALSVDAAAGSVKPFDARIHELRGHRARSTRPRRTASCSKARRSTSRTAIATRCRTRTACAASRR